VWRRPELTAIFIEQLRRLREKHDIISIVVASNGERFRKTHVIDHPNFPLGEKLNAGIKEAMRIGCTHVLLLGSDDFISDSLAEFYVRQAKESRFQMVGFLDCFFYDTKSKAFTYWSGYTGEREGELIGAGKMISRDILDLCNGNLFVSAQNRSMDASMSIQMSPFGVKTGRFRCRHIGEMVDVKDSHNITPFKMWPNSRNADKTLLNNIPESSKIIEL